MKLIEQIHNFLKNKGYTNEEIENFDATTVGIATEIALFAHHGQKRDRNKPYFFHPYAVMKNFRKLIGVVDGSDCVDNELIYKHGLVYDGIQESCLLHDVLEDTSLTMDDLINVFAEFGFENYFSLHIEHTLSMLTHQKDVPYGDYIEKITSNLSASIVKLMDLTDNMNMLQLNGLDEYCFQRTIKYVNAFKKINDVHHIVEKSKNYLEELY